MRGDRAGRRRPAMGRAARAAMAAALLVATAVMAAPVAGQDYRTSVGYNAGAILFGDLNQGAGSGALKLSPDAGWVVGVQAEHWVGSGQIGLRLNGAFTKRPMTLTPDRARTLSIGLADAGVVLRLFPVGPTHTVIPYVGVGGGFLYYGLGAGPEVDFPDANALYRGGNHLQPAATGSFGIDFLTQMHWDDQPIGFRVEASDALAKSPLRPISGNLFSPVHNMRVVLGVFTGVGSVR